MLSVEDWAEIRRLHRAEGLPIKVIARVLGISKNTVKATLASDQAPKYQRRQQGSIVDEVEPRVRELLQAYPRMPATVIAERIGWTRLCGWTATTTRCTLARSAAGAGARRPGPRAGVLRRPDRRRPCPDVGDAPNTVRPGPYRGSESVAPQPNPLDTTTGGARGTGA